MGAEYEINTYGKEVLIDSFSDEDENFDTQVSIVYDPEDPKPILVYFKEISGVNEGGLLLDETQTRRLIEALEQALVKMGNK